MSLDVIKRAIADKKLVCPTCGQPIRKFDKYVDLASSIWDGYGDSTIEYSGCKVTLVCGNGSCSWSERTEYWKNFLADN